MLNLRLFGPGLLTLDGRAVRLHSARALALLAFLCMEADRPHGRARLASLLWGGYPEASARQSLRQALHSLRTCADGALRERIETGPDFVRFVPGDGVELDVQRFCALVQSTHPQAWGAAADLCRAPLLDGLAVEDCDEFEAWLAATRDRLNALAAQNLERLVVDRVARSDWEGALHRAQALRNLDPLSEATSRHLLRIFAAKRDTRAIDAEWSRLRAALAREVGVEPSPVSAALYLRLRQGGEPAGLEETARAPLWTLPSDRPATAASSAPDSAASPTLATDASSDPDSAVAPALAYAASSTPASRDAGAADALVRAARAAERVYAFSNALELHERALGVLRRATPPSPERVCEVLLFKEAMLERLGRRAEQLAAIEEAAAIAATLPDPTTMATVMLRKAGANAYVGDGAGDGSAARLAAQRALEIFRDVGDRPGEAEALRELGFVAWRAGDYAAALRHSREALALHRRLGDLAAEASALHNLGEIHRGLGSPRHALEWYGQALPLHWAARNHEGEILTLFGEATAHREIGDLAQAGRRYAAALSLSERHGQRTMQSRALHALAAHERAQGRLDDALRFMQQAVDVDRAINYAHALSHDLVELAAIHVLRGERAQAGAALQEAIVWCEFTGESEAMAAVRAWLEGVEECGAPPGPLRPLNGGVKSHLSLPEGKVFCEFESPLARARSS